MIGEAIGNFRIVSLLGRGGMGEVYLAEHVAISTKVAIKVLRAEISRDHDQVQRFFNEARIVGKIKHAGIVNIFDVGFFQDHAYLIMELLEGESLATRLKERGPMSATKIADVGRQIASVLDSTHRAGVIHRDLKPDNIFLVTDDDLGQRERVKILDFGIAKLADVKLTSASIAAMGTPLYMSPEQWRSASTVDWRTDAYSLGCVAFEMASGRTPFLASSVAEACAAHLQEPPPSVRSVSPDVSPTLDRLITRLLAKTPLERGASMATIAAEFEVVGSPPATLAGGTDALTETVTARQPETPRPSRVVADTTLGATAGVLTPRRGARSRFVIAAGLIVVAGVASTAAVILSSNRDAPAEQVASASTSSLTEADVPPVPGAAVPPVDLPGPQSASIVPIDTPPVAVTTAAGAPTPKKSETAGPSPTHRLDAARPSVKKTVPPSVKLPDAAASPATPRAPVEPVRPRSPIEDAQPPSPAGDDGGQPHAEIEDAVPAAADSKVPDRLDRAMIKKGMAKVYAGVKNCGAGLAAEHPLDHELGVLHIKVTVTVLPDGSVATVSVKDAPNDWVVRCVTSRMKDAKFTKTRNGGSFSQPFSF